VAVVIAPAPAAAQIGVSITVAPPVLPVYAQPVIPGPGYLWTPGYWAWGEYGYFWVPGTWVQPPTVGYLWTPGYWGWADGVYLFHEGYWGPHIGFYGGINYGFGYVGVGYFGGRWENGQFAYNRAYSNVGTTVVNNTYNTTIVNNGVAGSRTSFNGGAGGVAARPTPAEAAAAAGPHVAPTPLQAQHVATAQADRTMYASANNGRPPVAATPRPAAFTGPGVVAARAAEAPHPPGGSAAVANAAARAGAAAGAGATVHAATAPHAPSAAAAAPVHAAAPAPVHAAAAPAAVHAAAAPRPMTPSPAAAGHPQPIAPQSAPAQHAAQAPRPSGGREEHR
jgi:hypothetical protein